VHEDGTLVGGEFQVNTTTISRQMQPAVTSDGMGQFLAVWTSYAGQPNNLICSRSRLSQCRIFVSPMAAPFVYAPYVGHQRCVSHRNSRFLATIAGNAVSNYQVFVDVLGVAAGGDSGNIWIMTATNGLAASSTHSFQVEYATTSGLISRFLLRQWHHWSGGTIMASAVSGLELYYGNSIAYGRPM